jgi:hypothetical protein
MSQNSEDFEEQGDHSHTLFGQNMGQLATLWEARAELAELHWM